MKKFRIIFWILIILALITVGVSLFLTSTRPGLHLISKKFLPDFIEADDIQVVDVSGRLSDELIFNQIELKNLTWFPNGTVIRVQRLSIKMKSLNPQDAQIDFENIRIFMPYSDPVVLSGHLRAGILSANVYTSNLSIEEFLSLLPNKIASNPKGIIKNIDLFLEGPLSAVQAKGTFLLDELVMPKFVISEAPGDVSLVFHRVTNGYSQTGQLRVTKGKVKTKNALIKLEDSKLYFSGSFGNPVFDIKGSSSISKVDIDVVLLGTPQAPEWRFSSNPPMDEEVLMLMFLTGKNMGSVQTSVDEKRLTPDLAKDLIDYFLLGGEGGRLAQKLGIKDLSIIYDKEKEVAGIGVKKEVTDFLDVGYQVEQQGSDPATLDVKHTVGAEWKLNRHLSVEVDKELYQFRNQERTLDPVKTDDKVILKYKTQF